MFEKLLSVFRKKEPVQQIPEVYEIGGYSISIKSKIDLVFTKPNGTKCWITQRDTGPLYIHIRYTLPDGTHTSRFLAFGQIISLAETAGVS